MFPPPAWCGRPGAAMVEVMAVLLAHQGGWDEALFVALPVAIFAVLLVRAKRNAEAEHEAEGAPEGGLAPDRRGGAERPPPDDR